MTLFYEQNGIQLIHGDATKIADYLQPESVDLIVTSPPYFALRSYQDGGEHYDGQIGDEETPQQFLEALWAVTEQCWKVLKPEGSLFINLGDKYAAKKMNWREKTLIGLPWRYAIGLIDDNGLAGGQWLLRSEIIWAKPNGLPESVRDRVARKHEQWFHFTKNERYFAAIDEIREPYKAAPAKAQKSKFTASGQSKNPTLQLDHDLQHNPKGKLPGSVWEIPTQPLTVPESLGVDHYAAFPMAWPYRIIKGWTPTGFCVECSEPRTPITKKDTSNSRIKIAKDGNSPDNSWGGNRRVAENPLYTINGYKCGCQNATAPTTPAIVLDPFGGTGTVAAIAKQLGRNAIHIDLSADYLRLAKWRIFDSQQAEKWIAKQQPKQHQERLPL